MLVNMTPKQWTDGKALLARRKNKKAPGVAVLVLKRAILIGPDQKYIVPTGWCERGDVVVVASGRRLRGLEEKGVVTRDVEIPPFPTCN